MREQAKLNLLDLTGVGIGGARPDDPISSVTRPPKNLAGSFPCAVALVRGALTPADIADKALADPEVLRLSRRLVMGESDEANALFPNRRIAKVALTLRDGNQVSRAWVEPERDRAAPPTHEQLHQKFTALAEPLGSSRWQEIQDVIQSLDDRPFSDLTDLICQPINR